jgi:hypothetical protein
MDPSRLLKYSHTKTRIYVPKNRDVCRNGSFQEPEEVRRYVRRCKIPERSNIAHFSNFEKVTYPHVDL